MAEKPDCRDCREIYALDNEVPDCKKCLPYLMPENKPIYSVYTYVCGQHIMADSTPIGLNLVPVFQIMDSIGIKKQDQLYCIDMIQRAYHEVLALRKKK